MNSFGELNRPRPTHPTSPATSRAAFRWVLAAAQPNATTASYDDLVRDRLKPTRRISASTLVTHDLLRPMPRLSAGLLMYRVRDGRLQVFLAHPGGPFFVRKDEGHWTIPKGEPDPDEDLLEAAKREFQEETGIVPKGQFIPLTPVKQKGGKLVHAWAFEGDYEEGKAIISNTFSMEWPPRSGRQSEFPEMDRAEFFDVPVAKRKVKEAQAALVDELERIVANDGRRPCESVTARKNAWFSSAACLKAGQ